MFKKILLALSFFVLLAVSCYAPTNLLTNPGIETGDYAGWTASIGAQVAGACTQTGLNMCIHEIKYEGVYGVSFSYTAATLTQEIDLVGEG